MSSSRPFSIDFAYGNVRRMAKPSSQSDKFKEAARELDCDDDEARFDERVKKLVKHKPVEKPER
jgi:hypothetical protein